MEHYRKRRRYHADYYVSQKDGSDSYNGKSRTFKGGTVGPFLTIAAGLAALAADATAKKCYVLNGTYFENGLTAGTGCSNKTLAIYPGHRPIWSGGVSLTGWTDTGSNIWTKSTGGTVPDQLVVNGIKQREARMPNYDSANPYTGGWAFVVSSGTGNNLIYRTTDITTAPIAGQYVLAVDASGFGSEILKILSVNTTTHTITFDYSGPTYAGGAVPNFTIVPGTRFFVFGGVTANYFNQAGEWWYNTSGTLISYNAGSGWDGTGAIIGTGERQAITINASVANFTIKGFRFTDFSTRNLDNDVPIGAINVDAAAGSANIIDGNTFLNCHQGVFDRAQATVVVHNTFESLQACGVATAASVGQIIRNNYFYRIGQWYKGSGAVDGYQCYQHTIDHNYFESLPRSAVSYISQLNGTTPHGQHTIQYNKSRDTMLETDDNGTYYLYEAGDTHQVGSTFKYNYTWNCFGLAAKTDGTGFEDGSATQGAGIYLDNGVNGCNIEANFIYGGCACSVNVHGGTSNTVQKNILINGYLRSLLFEAVDADSNGTTEAMTGTTLVGNIITGSLHGTTVSVDDLVARITPANVTNNVYYNPTAATLAWGPGSAYTFAQWQALGYDTGASGSSVQTSAIGFANESGGDYSLTAGFALTHGFVDLPWVLMGVQGS